MYPEQGQRWRRVEPNRRVSVVTILNVDWSSLMRSDMVRYRNSDGGVGSEKLRDFQACYAYTEPESDRTVFDRLLDDE